MSNGTQLLPTTDRDSGQVNPSLTGSVSPVTQSHTEALTSGTAVKSKDNRGQQTVWQDQVPATQPAPAGAQAQQQGGSGPVASSFPIGQGETQTAPQAAGAVGSVGRHSCFQVFSSKSNHMRIYNPSWGLGSISLNSLAPEMQVSQKGTGSISPSK